MVSQERLLPLMESPASSDTGSVKMGLGHMAKFRNTNIRVGKMSKIKSAIFEPLFNNPIALQILGICSALAVTAN